MRQYTIRDSNRLIEEFMLLANYLTAQHLIVHAGERAVLRRHPPPSADKLTMVRLSHTTVPPRLTALT